MLLFGSVYGFGGDGMASEVGSVPEVTILMPTLLSSTRRMKLALVFETFYWLESSTNIQAYLEQQHLLMYSDQIRAIHRPVASPTQSLREAPFHHHPKSADYNYDRELLLVLQSHTGLSVRFFFRSLRQK